jgi:Helix-turn-helix domain
VYSLAGQRAGTSINFQCGFAQASQTQYRKPSTKNPLRRWNVKVYALDHAYRIGQRLRDLRESKNLSQADIEQRSRLLRCYTSRVENRHTVPTVETLEKYAIAAQIFL